MVLRLLLILTVALALGVPAMSTSIDAASVAECDVGESAPDLDEAQVVAFDALPAAAVHMLATTALDPRAPAPPLLTGIFRPPRATFV